MRHKQMQREHSKSINGATAQHMQAVKSKTNRAQIPYNSRGISPDHRATMTTGGLERRGDGRMIFMAIGGEFQIHVLNLPEPAPLDHDLIICLPYGTEYVRDAGGTLHLCFPATVVPSYYSAGGIVTGTPDVERV